MSCCSVIELILRICQTAPTVGTYLRHINIFGRSSVPKRFARKAQKRNREEHSDAVLAPNEYVIFH